MTGEKRPPSTEPLEPLAGLLALAGWAVLALIVWIGAGWHLNNLHGLFPDIEYAGEILPQLHAIGAFLLLTAAAAGWGLLAGRLFPALMPSDSRTERFATVLLTGHVIVALLVLAVGLAGLLPGGLIVCLAGVAGLATERRAVAELLPRLRGREWLPAGLYVVVLTVAFLAALAPVVESDGLRYHLFGPQEYLKTGRIEPLPYHAFTNLPFQTNMLYTAVMGTGSLRAPQLVHWSYLPLIALLAARLAVRLGAARPVAIAAGLVAGTVPSILALSPWPFVDLSTTAFVLAAIVAVLRARQEEDAFGGVAAAGLFSGAAVATKLTAVFAGCFTGVFVLLLAIERRRVLPLVAAFAIPAVLISGVWFARNIVWHGNPVYPAAFGVFGGGEWTEEADAFYKAKAAEKGIGTSGVDFLLSPLDITIRWEGTLASAPPPEPGMAERIFGVWSPGFEDHNPGPAGLALVPAALVLIGVLARRRETRLVAVLLGLHLVGGWIAWFFTYQSVRFLYVPLILAMVAGMVMLARLARGGWMQKAVLGLAGVLAGASAAWFVTLVLFVSGVFPVMGGIGWLSRDQVVPARLNSYEAIEWLNLETEPGESVLYIGEYRGLYAEYDVLLSDFFDTPRILAEIRDSESNDAMIESWRERDIEYVLYNLAELRAYAALYFQPRFTPQEWRRFEELHERLTQQDAVVFQPRDSVMVIDVSRL